jgi:hypothetical protein
MRTRNLLSALAALALTASLAQPTLAASAHKKSHHQHHASQKAKPKHKAKSSTKSAKRAAPAKPKAS